MTVNLYKTTDDHRTINRSKTAIASGLSIITKGAVDRSSPVLYLKTDTVGTSNLDDINYMYISEFGRYYFCKVTAVPGGMVEVAGKVDVLALPGVKNVSGLVIKSETFEDKYINDGDYVAESREYTQSFNFNDMFLAEPCTYLIALGGDAGGEE